MSVPAPPGRFAVVVPIVAAIVAASVAASVFASVFAGCSSDASPGGAVDQSLTQPTTTLAAPIPIEELPLRVDQIDAAIAAVDAAQGGPQMYFEVNATPTIVNLFVATDDATRAVAYVFVGGVLQEPAAPEVASGQVFTGTDVAFEVTKVLAQVAGSLPTSMMRLFAVSASAAGTPQYLISLESDAGGVLDITVGPDGTILGVDPG